MVECLQAYPTTSTSRRRLWMCVCARVLTPLHEDEIWMSQMKAFLSLVPLNAGSSAESRGLDSTLGAVLIRCCPASFPKQDVLSEELHKVTFLDVSVHTIVVVAEDQPILT